MNLDRVRQTLQTFNQFGASDTGITRLAYTEEDQKSRDYFVQLCQKEKLQVHIDECGNIIARREGADPNLPAVTCGSHLDTVIQGGAFDGTVGVVGGLELIRSFNERNVKTKHPIELIVFACEESSRFGYSTLGSKGMTGILNKESISHLRDHENISIQEAFAKCNLNFENLEKAVRKRECFKAFVELHIEQGPVLEQKKKQIGIVTGIAAPTRLKVNIKGKAAHSGSTSMDYRKDALLGASEIALALEHAAQKESHRGTVGTVGVFNIKPGAMNVIPGLAEMQIDIRGIDKLSKQRVLNDLYQCFERIKANRKLEIEWEIISDEDPVLLDQHIIDLMALTCEEMGITYERLPSGAGHDAMNMAKICPTGMIFIPSRDGLSHNPDEYTSWEEIGTGIELLEQLILKLSIPITA